MIYWREGSETANLTGGDLKKGLFSALDQLGRRRKVLLIPPDQTRIHSRAGDLTCMAYEYYGTAVSDILPALGTHKPMDPGELDRMFPGVPHHLFRVHDWRNDVITLGEVPAEFVRKVSGEAVAYPFPVQVNQLITTGGHDLILSIGQVVPHEVIGMANYNKNLLIGCGGHESINKSHFLGAVHGMERIMGRPDNPVRQVLNYASREFLSGLPVVYVHTVVDQQPAVRGLFIGDDESVFTEAAGLSLKVNFTLLDKPLEKVIVYLDPREYRSTWLGNKAIYRTRMALADGGELIILAPGVREFGEDREIDRLIRKFGYRGTRAILESVREDPGLAAHLSAAAHLIHGSSEGRFRITYCTVLLSRKEIESVGFKAGDLDAMIRKYDPDKLAEGFNKTGTGEEIFFIGNPALGLWSTKSRFDESGH